jgi:hypothetical protein
MSSVDASTNNNSHMVLSFLLPNHKLNFKINEAMTIP